MGPGLTLTEQKPKETDTFLLSLTSVQDTLRDMAKDVAVSKDYSGKGYEGQQLILRELDRIQAKLDRPGRSMDTAALAALLVERGAKPEAAAKLAAEIKARFS